MPHLTLTRLDDAIDQVHTSFDVWADDGALAAVLTDDGESVLRLAVHEWIANLVQHASFPRGTQIELEIEIEGDGVRCAIEDSSIGFDFAGQVEHQSALLDAPAPSERGRGLLMLITCSEDLSFRPATPEAPQQIAFRVRAGIGAALFAPLFRPEDLADDFSLADTLPDAGSAWGDVKAFAMDPPLSIGEPFDMPGGDSLPGEASQTADFGAYSTASRTPTASADDLSPPLPDLS